MVAPAKVSTGPRQVLLLANLIINLT